MEKLTGFEKAHESHIYGRLSFRERRLKSSCIIYAQPLHSYESVGVNSLTWSKNKKGPRW